MKLKILILILAIFVCYGFNCGLDAAFHVPIKYGQNLLWTLLDVSFLAFGMFRGAIGGK